MADSSRAELALKRLIDVAGALALGALTAPLLGLVAVMIPAKLGRGGIFFRQRRPGLQEKPFSVVKFRTMLEAFDSDGQILPESQRLPPFGWFLRKYSIDEIPQIWNVLRGEMSLVGPRPLLMEYLEAYPPEYRRRHDVKPGISGWAQINGRHSATFKERLEMDVWYVDNWSLALDLKIIALTLWRLVRPQNVERPDQPREAVDDLNLHRRVKPRTKGSA
jgi:sugar transferase EpsL